MYMYRAYDKTTIQSNGRETTSYPVPSNYEMKMLMEINGEVGHNLDLNLGISILVDGPKGNKNVQLYPRPPKLLSPSQWEENYASKLLLSSQCTGSLWPTIFQSTCYVAWGTCFFFNSCEMRMLRWMCRHTRMDRIKNDAIRGKFGVASIGDKLRESRLRWFGHVQRRSLDATVRRCERLDFGVCRRDRGQPKKRWMDSIKQDIKLLRISVALAQCRKRWKEKIRVADNDTSS